MAFPYDWYWLADDGRVFSSKTQAKVAGDDPDYAAWCISNTPTPWPRDGSGNQTDQSLQDAIGQFNLYANLAFYTTHARVQRAQGGVVITSLSPVAFLTDILNRNAVNSAYDYLLENTGQTISWPMQDGSYINVDTNGVTKMNNTIAQFVHNCYTCEATTDAGITEGTITTRAQVDAAFAAVANVFP